jgi:hypothetical protein
VKAKRVVRKTAFGSMLAMVCFGVFALAGSTPAQEGASGYHLLKKVQLSGAGGWDYLAIDLESRRLFISTCSNDRCPTFRGPEHHPKP